MDSNGSNKRRLTYFNEKGCPEYIGRRSPLASERDGLRRILRRGRPVRVQDTTYEDHLDRASPRLKQMRPTYYSGADVHRRSALMSDVKALEKV